jgi:MFS family permease
MESRNPGRAREFDLRGAVAATLGLSLLVLGIVRTDQTGWGDTSTLLLIAAGIGLLAGFVLIEGRVARSPLMPLRIYRSRTLTAANIIVLLVGGASFGMWFFMSLYLQQVHGYSPIRAGLAFLPMTLCIVAGSTAASRLVGRVGAKPILIAGMASLSVGLFWLSDISVNGTYVGAMLFPSLLTALGIGLAFVPATISAVAGVAPQEAGLASGLVNTARLFGGALGLALLAAIATARTNSDLHHAGTTAHAALVSGFQLAFLVSGALAFVGGLVAAFGLPRLPARAPAQPGQMAPAESA